MAWACLSQKQQRKSTAAASAFPARTERSGLLFTNDVERTCFQTAETIRKTVESETGLTVSIGVSFSKIFAKLGSDMKKIHQKLGKNGLMLYQFANGTDGAQVMRPSAQRSGADRR